MCACHDSHEVIHCCLESSFGEVASVEAVRGDVCVFEFVLVGDLSEECGVYVVCVEYVGCVAVSAEECEYVVERCCLCACMSSFHGVEVDVSVVYGDFDVCVSSSGCDR